MDSDRVRQHLEALKQAPWIGNARRWWPDFLFHCTDVRNAARILAGGALLSRTRALETDRMVVDIASPEIIDRTASHWWDFVRLYFRPRTPTQFANEGIRIASDVRYGAQCPVPIYLMFDAVNVLSRRETRFTQGNLASRGSPSRDIEDFAELPFDQIYHEGPFDNSQPNNITFHRNAEVLIPEQLDLTALQRVECRSHAEYETLLSLLPASIRRRWATIIGVNPEYQLFHNRWTFVERVSVMKGVLSVRFNSRAQSPGPFVAELIIEEASTGELHRWRQEGFHANQALRIGLSDLSDPSDIQVSLYLDDHLAYSNRFLDDSLPF